MIIELFVDAHKNKTRAENFRIGMYILPDNVIPSDESREYTMFGNETFDSYHDALAAARSDAKRLFPDAHIAGVYPAPGMVEGDLRTV